MIYYKAKKRKWIMALWAMFWGASFLLMVVTAFLAVERYGTALVFFFHTALFSWMAFLSVKLFKWVAIHESPIIADHDGVRTVPPFGDRQNIPLDDIIEFDYFCFRFNTCVRAKVWHSDGKNVGIIDRVLLWPSDPRTRIKKLAHGACIQGGAKKAKDDLNEILQRIRSEDNSEATPSP